MKTLKIRDYNGTWYDTGIKLTKKAWESIDRIILRIITGDDIVTIEYNDHSEEYDAADYSKNYRTSDYYDYYEVLYDRFKNVDIIEEYLNGEIPDN